VPPNGTIARRASATSPGAHRPHATITAPAASQTAGSPPAAMSTRAVSDGLGWQRPHWKCGKSRCFHSPPQRHPNLVNYSATRANHSSGWSQAFDFEITSTASPYPCQLCRLVGALVTGLMGGTTVRPRA